MMGLVNLRESLTVHTTICCWRISGEAKSVTITINCPPAADGKRCPQMLSLPTMPSSPANPRMSVIGGILPMTRGRAAATSSSDNSTRMSAPPNAPVTGAGVSDISDTPGGVGMGVGDGNLHSAILITDHQSSSTKIQFSFGESKSNSPSKYMSPMTRP